MVAVAPFRALRYDAEVVEDLSRVIAPPYDVIGPDDQTRLYDASPYNVVRLILGRDGPGDTPQENRYTRARRAFEAWGTNGVFRQDEAASFSLLEHEFVWDGRPYRRLGFLGLLQLDDAVDRWVLRHEATLDSPKADRARLLEAVPANLSPIFCVFPDPERRVHRVLEAAVQNGPLWATVTVGGEIVRVRRLTDETLHRQIAERLAHTKVLIADGHHRFEVARAHRARYGAVMAYFVSMEDPGLLIRPLHRLVPGSRAGLSALQSWCRVESERDASAVLAWMDGTSAEAAFGCYAEGRWHRVTITESRVAQWLMNPTVPLPVAGLDVVMLHELIFPALGVEGQVRYTPDPEAAAEAVERRACQMAWLVRGVPIHRVYAIADQGVTLPPKSTFFYPKVPSGLAFNPF